MTKILDPPLGIGDAGGLQGTGRGTICRAPGRGTKGLSGLHFSSALLQVHLILLLSRECLVWLGFNDHLPIVRRVSRGWKVKVELSFHHRLHVLGSRRQLLPSRVLHDQATGTRTPFPALPDGGGLTVFSKLATFGEGLRTELVVMLGGWATAS